MFTMFTVCKKIQMTKKERSVEEKKGNTDVHESRDEKPPEETHLRVNPDKTHNITRKMESL